MSAVTSPFLTFSSLNISDLQLANISAGFRNISAYNSNISAIFEIYRATSNISRFFPNISTFTDKIEINCNLYKAATLKPSSSQLVKLTSSPFPYNQALFPHKTPKRSIMISNEHMTHFS